MTPPLTPFKRADADNVSWDAAAEQMAIITAIYNRSRTTVENILLQTDGGELLLWFDPDAPENADLADVPGFCLIKQGGAYWVAIEGTRPRFSQWRQNFTGAWLRGDFFGSSTDVVHGFFGWCALHVYAKITPLIEGRAFATVNLSGHSLGGATANLLSMRLKQDCPQSSIWCITFGEPRSIPRTTRFPTIDGKWRVVNGADVVEKIPGDGFALFRGDLGDVLTSLLPQSDWQHYGERREIHEDGSFSDRQQDVQRRETEDPRTDRVVVAHYPSSYIRSLANVQRNYGTSNHSQTVLALGAALVQSDEQIAALGLTAPSRFVDVAALNAAVGATSDPVFDATNWQTYSVSNIEPTTATVGPEGSYAARISGNKVDFPMPSIIGTSGTWRCVAQVNNLHYGDSHSVVCRGPRNKEEAKAAFFKWVAARAALLGATRTVADYAAGNFDPQMGTPVYQWMTMYDVTDPSRSVPVLIPAETGHPFCAGAGANTGADHFANGLSVRLTGQNEGDTVVQRYHNESFVGFPDILLYAGKLSTTARVSGAKTWRAAMDDYLNLLCNDTLQFGFMGVDPSVPKKTVTVFATNGIKQLLCTVPAHGYSNGDKVKLTGRMARKIRKTYTVSVVDVDTVKLLESRVADEDVPRVGKLQRIRMASGTRQMTFFRFQTPTSDDGNGKTVIKITKRNLRPKSIPISFAQKGRKR